MTTTNLQRSDWFFEGDSIVQCENSSSTNKGNSIISSPNIRSCSSISPCVQGLIFGIITASLFLAVFIAIWLTSLRLRSTTTTTGVSTASTSTSSITTTTLPTCSSSGHGTLASFVGNPTVWTQYQYNYTANATVQTIMFGFTTDLSGYHYWFLDDVSVVDVTAPNTQLLQNPSFDNSTTALTGWTQYCTNTCSNGNTNAGQVTTGSNCSSTNCYMDHCYGNNAIDFLSQTFPTTIGHIYTISFRLNDFGHGPNGQTIVYVDIY